MPTRPSGVLTRLRSEHRVARGRSEQLESSAPHVLLAGDAHTHIGDQGARGLGLPRPGRAVVTTRWSATWRPVRCAAACPGPRSSTPGPTDRRCAEAVGPQPIHLILRSRVLLDIVLEQHCVHPRSPHHGQHHDPPTMAAFPPGRAPLLRGESGEHSFGTQPSRSDYGCSSVGHGGVSSHSESPKASGTVFAQLLDELKKTAAV
jgi:hypothetical protein